MNDYGLFAWLGGMAVIFGLLGIIGILAFWVDHRYSEWQEKKGKEMGTFSEDKRDDDEGD